MQTFKLFSLFIENATKWICYHAVNVWNTFLVDVRFITFRIVLRQIKLMQSVNNLPTQNC